MSQHEHVGHDHAHFICCEQVHHGEEAFKRHRVEAHGEAPWRCACGASAPGFRGLVEHMREAHGANGPDG